MTCTFFGHRNTPQEIQPKLQDLLVDLIENQGVDTFYVGNQGHFDFIIRQTLKALKELYPSIKYSVVLAYIPGKKDEFSYEDYSDTLFPAGLENTPPKFAISKRNRWLIDNSDIVITYVKTPIGGAATFKEIAEKKGREVINLYP